jgi:CRP/FNR family transcriptional regulator, cyclic AMP receptor protein
MSSTDMDEEVSRCLSPPLQALAKEGVICEYTARRLIVHEGEPSTCLYVVLSGRVRVFSGNAEGREITHGVLAAGAFFDETCLHGETHVASAIADEDCLCVAVPIDTVRAYLSEHQALAEEVLARALERTRAAIGIARDVVLLDVYGRLVRTIGDGTSPGQTFPYTLTAVTHQQIASRLGATRKMVSRLLKDLEIGGYVRRGKREITILRKLPARW